LVTSADKRVDDIIATMVTTIRGTACDAPSGEITGALRSRI